MKSAVPPDAARRQDRVQRTAAAVAVAETQRPAAVGANTTAAVHLPAPEPERALSHSWQTAVPVTAVHTLLLCYVSYDAGAETLE